MQTGAVSQEQEQIARSRIEVYARSMFAIKGLSTPGPDVLSNIINSAVSRLSTSEVMHPDSISIASIGDIQALVKATQTPAATNLYGADAPAGGMGKGLNEGGIRNADLFSMASRGNISLRSSSDTGDGSRAPGTSSRLGGDYQLLDLNSPQSLQQLTGTGWGNTAASLPYARAGLNFGTVNDLRNYDRNLTGQDVLKAASDVKGLGFDANDKRAMRDHAVIRHYDNNADATNEAEKKFKAGIDGDKDMQELLRQRGLCKDPAQQKAFDAQIEQRKQSHMGESGLQKRMDDPDNHPKAKAAIKDDVDHIMHKNRDYRHDNDRKASRELSSEARAEKKAHSGVDAATDREKSKVADRAAGESTRKIAAASDDVFGKADGPSDTAPSKDAVKPKPTKIASRGPGMTAG